MAREVRSPHPPTGDLTAERSAAPIARELRSPHPLTGDLTAKRSAAPMAREVRSPHPPTGDLTPRRPRAPMDRELRSPHPPTGDLTAKLASLRLGNYAKIVCGSPDEKITASRVASTPPHRGSDPKEAAVPDSEDLARFKQIRRKKEFESFERVRGHGGRPINVLSGLELHTDVFDASEQRQIVQCVYDLQQKGRRGELQRRTYLEPHKWQPGKGRVTIQFGCCYNYRTERDGTPPGIIRGEEVDPLPSLFKRMIKRMVKFHVLPPSCVPNSCIVNIYEEGDCIPPHIDHHDFLRPFCTVSFLSECEILFGSALRPIGPGQFSGSFAIPLPVGSVLVLSGNGADVAQHCIPAVPTRRISITFRRMDQSKLPYGYTPDPDLQNLQPLLFTRPVPTASLVQQPRQDLHRPDFPFEQRAQVASLQASTRTISSSEQEDHLALSQTPVRTAQAVRQQGHAAPLRQGYFHPRTREGPQATDRKFGSTSNSFQLSEEEFPSLGSASSSSHRPVRR